MNPIAKLKQEGMSFVEMSERTGLHLQTLYSLSKQTDEEMLKTIKVETAVRMHEGLGISLGFLIDAYKKIKE